MDKKRIVYVGNFDFPFGNASGKRVYGNGKMLREVGYEVVFVGMSSDVQPKIVLQSTKKEFDGFEYYNFSYPKGTREWIHYKEILENFIEWMQDKKELTVAIVCYGSPRISMFITGLLRWAKRYDIKVISDCVDWLESKTGKIAFDVAKMVDTYYQKAIANKRVDGVFCISSYLETYYQKARKKTVIIPPLSTYISEQTAINKGHTLQIVYAGSSFRDKTEIKNLPTLKDRVDKMIDILRILKEKGIEFKFWYYGIDKENYVNAFPAQKDVVDYIGESIIFCGFQDNVVVTEKIKESDFTFLVRDIKKSTMSGFPTKVSESISYGTPVITTRTSDIEKYLTEGEQVIFVDENDLKKSAELIEQVILENKYEYMKHKCLGNEIFYFETFKYNAIAFMEKL